MTQTEASRTFQAHIDLSETEHKALASTIGSKRSHRITDFLQRAIKFCIYDATVTFADNAKTRMERNQIEQHAIRRCPKTRRNTPQMTAHIRPKKY